MDSETYARALRHARRVCPADPAIDAEDVVQSAWVKCGALLPDLPGDLDRLRLMTRCVNQVATDHHRKAKRLPVSLPDWHPAPSSVEAEVATRVQLEAVLALVAAGDLYAAAALLFGLGYEYREVAARQGVAAGTALSRVARFRAREGMQA